MQVNVRRLRNVRTSKEHIWYRTATNGAKGSSGRRNDDGSRLSPSLDDILENLDFVFYAIQI